MLGYQRVYMVMSIYWIHHPDFTTKIITSEVDGNYDPEKSEWCSSDFGGIPKPLRLAIICPIKWSFWEYTPFSDWPKWWIQADSEWFLSAMRPADQPWWSVPWRIQRSWSSSTATPAGDPHTPETPADPKRQRQPSLAASWIGCCLVGDPSEIKHVHHWEMGLSLKPPFRGNCPFT